MTTQQRSHDLNDDTTRKRVLDTLLARYVDEYHAGMHPNLRELLLSCPELAVEVFDFVLYFHCFEADLPEPDPAPVAPLSPAAERALAIIRRMTRAGGRAFDDAPAERGGVSQAEDDRPGGEPGGEQAAQSGEA